MDLMEWSEGWMEDEGLKVPVRTSLFKSFATKSNEVIGRIWTIFEILVSAPAWPAAHFLR